MSKKMKRLIFVFIVALALSSSAMAVEIAISTQGGWMGQGHADTEAQEIVDNVTGVSIEVFTPTDLDALADWIVEHTGDGLPDLLIMFGIFPATIYPAGNAQPDGSLAEQFLDDGNVIVNTGDYIFYVGSAGNNDAGGLANMMDVPAATMWGDDSFATMFTPTADGQEYTPSLTTLPANRPWIPAQFVGTDWEFELILAQTSDGSQVHPAILQNTVTGGRVGVFFQCSQDTDNQLRGEVISEWINNWYLPYLGSGGGNPYPRRPDPEDGALHEDTWISLAWRAGYYAVSHDAYISDNFDDVNSGAESAYAGNLGMANLVAGFPGFPLPDGLVPGTTYYWRIDEVNEAEPNSPWRGPVWSFSVPPRTAYNANPVDGAKFIDPDADLSWAAGFGAKLHTVYFGESFDDVNNAAGGTLQGILTYDPGTLERDKTYYWRVDEFDAFTTHKGNVWSFTTAKVGGGIKGEYFNNENLTGAPVLVRTDPQINFYWNPGPNPPPGINEDYFSVRWTGELEAPFSEPFTFITGTDDGARMYLDGKLIINDWGAGHDYTEVHSEPIDLVEGQYYSMVLEGFELGGEAEWRLYWQSPSMPRQVVPQAALSLPVKASSPKPTNGAVDVSQRATLSWGAGDAAASHEVYFGTDGDAVRNADTSSPEYRGSRQLGSESYDPGQLQWDVTYYWRVDEIEDGGTIQTGNVWNFTTANFLIVDDMESYNDINEGEPGSNRIYIAWVDGYDSPATNGSTVGHLDPPFAEQTIVHSGNQSMPYAYNNAVRKSEATKTLDYPRNWTENGVDTLVIWYIGDAANAAETMYVVLNGTSGVDNPDANAAQVTDWTEWRISLQDFGMNLTNVNTITIGFGNRANPSVGGSGAMFFDDIRLYAPAP